MEKYRKLAQTKSRNETQLRTKTKLYTRWKQTAPSVRATWTSDSWVKDCLHVVSNLPNLPHFRSCIEPRSGWCNHLSYFADHIWRMYKCVLLWTTFQFGHMVSTINRGVCECKKGSVVLNQDFQSIKMTKQQWRNNIDNYKIWVKWGTQEDFNNTHNWQKTKPTFIPK